MCSARSTGLKNHRIKVTVFNFLTNWTEYSTIAHTMQQKAVSDLSPSSITWYWQKLGGEQTQCDAMGHCSLCSNFGWCLAERQRIWDQCHPMSMWFGKDFTFTLLMYEDVKVQQKYSSLWVQSHISHNFSILNDLIKTFLVTIFWICYTTGLTEN